MGVTGAHPSWLILPRNPFNAISRKIVNNFAATLAGRYNAKVGCTRSWDTSDPTDFTVSFFLNKTARSPSDILR